MNLLLKWHTEIALQLISKKLSKLGRWNFFKSKLLSFQIIVPNLSKTQDFGFEISGFELAQLTKIQLATVVQLISQNFPRRQLWIFFKWKLPSWHTSVPNISKIPDVALDVMVLWTRAPPPGKQTCPGARAGVCSLTKGSGSLTPRWKHQTLIFPKLSNILLYDDCGPN